MTFGMKWNRSERKSLASMLKEISSGIEERFYSKGQLAKDQKDATNLEFFLQALKYKEINTMVENGQETNLLMSGMSIAGILQAKLNMPVVMNKLDGLLSQAQLQLIYDLIKSHTANKKILGQLFLNRSQQVLSRGAQLENDLAQIASAVAHAALGKAVDEFQAVSFATGKQQGDVFKVMADDMNKHIVKALKDLVGDKTVRDNAGTRFIKTDVDNGGLLKIAMMTNIDPSWTKILVLLGQATFSAKNSASRSWRDLRSNEAMKAYSWRTTNTAIHFGATELIKTLNGVFSELHMTNINLADTSTANKLIYGMYQVLKDGAPGSLVEQVTQVFNHIKLLYEIKGAGQFNVTTNSMAPEVRFVVYNDPTSHIIKVIPALQLIKEMLEQNRGQNVKVSITVSRDALTKETG